MSWRLDWLKSYFTLGLSVPVTASRAVVSSILWLFDPVGVGKAYVEQLAPLFGWELTSNPKNSPLCRTAGAWLKAGQQPIFYGPDPQCSGTWIVRQGHKHWEFDPLCWHFRRYHVLTNREKRSAEWVVLKENMSADSIRLDLLELLTSNDGKSCSDCSG